MWFNTFSVPPVIILCTVAVLPAILPPFLWTAAIRKTIVILFVKEGDNLTAWTHWLCVCVCMWCVCVSGFHFTFLFFILDLFFLSPCTIEQWLAYHWLYAYHSMGNRSLTYKITSFRKLQSASDFSKTRKAENLYVGPTGQTAESSFRNVFLQCKRWTKPKRTILQIKSVLLLLCIWTTVISTCNFMSNEKHFLNFILL
jgi:hypothetical protein